MTLGRSVAEPALFAGFYRANAEAVLLFFTRRTFDVEIARDLTAETFAQAYEHRHRFRECIEEEAGGWLFAIARHQHARYARGGVVERKAVTTRSTSSGVTSGTNVREASELDGPDSAQPEARRRGRCDNRRSPVATHNLGERRRLLCRPPDRAVPGLSRTRRLERRMRWRGARRACGRDVVRRQPSPERPGVPYSSVGGAQDRGPDGGRTRRLSDALDDSLGLPGRFYLVELPTHRPGRLVVTALDAEARSVAIRTSGS